MLTDIKSYNLKSLRSQIALVSKEPTLFAGSIRGNIIYGKEEATESEIKKAAICANANEFQRYDNYKSLHSPANAICFIYETKC